MWTTCTVALTDSDIMALAWDRFPIANDLRSMKIGLITSGRAKIKG